MRIDGETTAEGARTGPDSEKQGAEPAKFTGKQGSGKKYTHDTVGL